MLSESEVKSGNGMKVFKRTVSALATAAVVVCGLLYLPDYIVKGAVIALILLVQLEFSQMVARKHPVMTWAGVAAGALFLVSKFYLYEAGLPLIIFGVALCALFSKGERPVAALATTLLGFVYIPLMLQYLVIIPEKFGMAMLLYVIAIVKISDMGGFAFGMAFGRHKMCPAISPGKSWEGMAGSIFASCVVSCAFMPLTKFPPPKALLFGGAAAVVGTLGDLVESRMKRECGVKDSATFMPAGLGGFLDMFDSLVFAPAVLYFFI